MARFAIILACLALSMMAFAGERFEDVYAEAVWSDLTGLSSIQSARVGTRNGNTDLYLTLRNEWYDTMGTDLPFQYRARGSSVGVGVRQWILNRRATIGVSVGKVIDGPEPERLDVRAGMAGYDSWEDGKRFTDLYGELFWVSRADDAFLYLRYRPGLTLRRDENGRLWVYGVGALWASGEGDLGTENRVEGGIGLGYIYHDHLTANLELRAGHSYSGTVSDRNYLNPTVVVAGNF